MANLEKIIKVTQEQYDILASGGKVGDYVGLQDNYIYMIEDEETKTTTISEASTDNQYPSAKAVYNFVKGECRLIETTWAELKALRDNSQLTPGRFYRITDYTCTTAQENTQSAGHQFDIIIQALDKNTLDEKAIAIQHVGDTYFANSKLESWQLKYCLDNDTNRFAWADSTNGKGVIYRMVDEFNNDCPYDFKNIQFKRYKITECQKSPSLVGEYLGIENVRSYTINTGDFIWCYTFTWINENNVIEDSSIVGQKLTNDEGQYSGVCDNKLAECSAYLAVSPEAPESFGIALNNIVIQYSYEYHSGFFSGIHDNTFKDNCYNNTLGSACHNNTFAASCCYNIFGGSCECNTFGNGCNRNIFGNGCYNNTFGDNCNGNIFDTNGYSNTFDTSCSSNTLGDSCEYTILGAHCFSNTFGPSCFCNTLNNTCSYIKLGTRCSYNTFGNGCSYIVFGGSSNYPRDYYQYNIIDNGCSYLCLYSNATGSYNYQLQNVHIHSGVAGTYNNYKLIKVDINLSYTTDVYPSGSTEMFI